MSKQENHLSRENDEKIILWKKGRLKGKHLLYPSLKMKIITTLFQDQLVRDIDKCLNVIPIGVLIFKTKGWRKINAAIIIYLDYWYIHWK